MNNWEISDAMDDTEGHIRLSDLPLEIVHKILQSNSVTYVELCRFSETCSKFNCIVNQNELWKQKFVQQWPKLAKAYVVPSSDSSSNVDWKQECRARHVFVKTVKQKLADMSENLYSCENSVKYIYKDFQSLIQEHKIALHFLVDELESQVFDGCSNRNLTEKYYGLRLLRFARQQYFFPLLKMFLYQAKEHQAPEIGASFIALYCQPSAVMTVEHISKALDDIAVCVKEEIIHIDKLHPVLSVDLIPPNRHLEKSLWSSPKCEIILNCINNVLFWNLQYKTLLNNSVCDTSVYIDKVLTNKHGIPVTMVIIYMAIAHRLGVHLYATCFKNIYLVKWLQHPDLEDDILRYSYIDVSMGGKVVPASDCFRYSANALPIHKHFRTITPTEMMMSICKLLTETCFDTSEECYDSWEDRLVVRSSAFELYSLFESISIDCNLSLVHIYIQLKIKLHEACRILNKILHYNPNIFGILSLLRYVEDVAVIECQESDVQQGKMSVKYRSNYPQVSFAVGMIMRHKRHNYVGVINGWDSECCADEIEIARMGVRKLRFKDKQPFYNILVEDGTCRYAAEENLEPCKFPYSFPHYKVGKYFHEFLIDHYIPNKQMEQEYPEDSVARDEMLRKHACTPFSLDAGSSFKEY